MWTRLTPVTGHVMDKQNCYTMAFYISRTVRSLGYLNFLAFLFRKSVGNHK